MHANVFARGGHMPERVITISFDSPQGLCRRMWAWHDSFQEWFSASNCVTHLLVATRSALLTRGEMGFPLAGAAGGGAGLMWKTGTR